MNSTPIPNTVKPEESTYTNTYLLNITTLCMAEEETLSKDYVLGGIGPTD